MLSSLICGAFALITLCSVNGLVLTSDTFENSPCIGFFYKQQEVTGFAGNQYTRICQLYKNRYYFASLYDKQRRIPLYSAFLYNYKDPEDDDTKERTDTNWKYEQQLADPQADGNLRTLDRAAKENQAIRQNQPVEIDYNRFYNGVKYSRGHLNPNSYQGSKVSKASTFTVTNAPPQPDGFNKNQWSNIETNIAERLNERCHVVSGVIPYQEEKWLSTIPNYNVAVPQFVWLAYCCPDKTGSVLGHSDGPGTVTFGEGADKLEFPPAEIKELSVPRLEAILSSRFNPTTSITIFRDGCQ